MRRLHLLGFVALLVAALPGVAEAIVNGACCNAGVCTEITAGDCAGGGGVYQGDFTTCAGAVCPAALPSVGNGGLVMLAIVLLGAATWLLFRRRRTVSEA